MTQKNENTGRVILVIVGILVLSALGYFATRYFSVKKEAEQKDVVIEDLKVEITQLEDEIVSLNTTIEDANIELAEKDKLLSERDQQLASLRDKLQRYKNTNAANLKEVKELENRLKLAEAQINSYETRILALESTIASQADTIATQRAQSQQQLSTISQLAQSNQQKAERLKRAGALQAADFAVYNVKKNGKEIRDIEFRRSSFKSLKVCFNVLKNAEADAGERELYLVYENPDGTTSTNDVEGLSGSFNFQGRNTPYSSRTNINYTLITQEVCMGYQIPSDQKYQKGTQFITIIGEDRIMGQTSFSIK